MNAAISLEAYQALEKEIASLQEEIKKLRMDLGWANYLLNQLKRLIYGRKSERFVSFENGQLSMDLDIETSESKQIEAEKTIPVTYQRHKPAEKKNPAIRLSIPSHLPRKEEIIEPENVPQGAKKIGEEITETLELTEAKIHVRKIVRPKYALAQDGGVIIANLPSLPIAKGNAGPSLLAHLLISKYVDHLPFYRQRQQIKRQGLDIPQSTMSGWFSASCRLLEPLYNNLRKKLLASHYLQADETPISVLDSEKKGSTHQGYHWVYHAPLVGLVCFDYQQGRGREGPRTFLQNFNGILQTDGYAVYNDLKLPGNIILHACMAHARRKFEHALENDAKRAGYALEQIQQLYGIERKAKEAELSYKDRKQLRNQEATLILNNLEAWMKEELMEVLPKSAIGKAIAYTLNLWPRLKRYTQDGRCEIDNNLIENTIRPVAIGRKNYLFAGSHEAAQYAAMMYSFLGTCKLNSVEPLSWLRDVLTRISDHPVNRLEELLPVKAKILFSESQS